MASADLLTAVHRCVHRRRDEIIDLVLELVAISSVTGNEYEIQTTVQRHLADRGLGIDRWVTNRDDISPYIVHVGEQSRYDNRPHLVGTRAGSGGGRSLMFQGHTDTVDVGDEALWTTSPTGEVLQNRVYGRGAADMKSGIASYISVLDVLSDLGISLQGDLKIASSIGEEDGGYGALATILRGHRADAALIAEPTNLEIVLAGGGSLVFRLIVHGKSAHGANRNQGVSALDKFYPIYLDLLSWEAERNEALQHPLYDRYENKLPISVGVVRAGTWASTVPDELVAEGRLGFLPGETIDGMQQQAVARIQSVATRDEWLREHPPLMKWIGGQFAASEISPDEPIAATLAAAHQSATGELAPTIGITSGLDARLFINIADIPTVVYGAGDLAHVHCADEWIDIDDLLTAIEVMTITAIQWCGISEFDNRVGE